MTQAQAHHKVSNAIARGRLVRPDTCEYCGEGGRIEGHHSDYDRPLDVTWLCKLCHVNVHRPQLMERGRIAQLILQIEW